MKLSSKFILPLILLSLLASGCSSIISGTTQKVTITSNINGADVIINGTPVGKTPVTTRVKREKNVHITVRKEGYSDYNSVTETKLDPWFWGNIIIGGVFGSTTDLATGTTHLIEQDHMHIQMEELNKGKKTTLNMNDKMPQVQEYTLLSYHNLLREIKTNQGEYLKGLYSIKGIKSKNEEVKFLNYLKTITTDKTTALEFAQKVETYNNLL